MAPINCTQTPPPTEDETSAHPEPQISEVTTNQTEEPPPPAQEEVPQLTEEPANKSE